MNREMFALDQEEEEDDTLSLCLLVQNFSDDMLGKLYQAHSKGKRGWDSPAECPPHYLLYRLKCAVDDSDWVSVGNYAAMLQYQEENK